jgi:hypothetical protein
MRPSRLLAALTLFVLLFAFIPYMSAPARAANPPTTVGTIVATPQPTPPTALFLQVGSQTVPVMITSNTDVDRSDGTKAPLSELKTGDKIEVVGFFNASGGINASSIRDLSLVSVQPPQTFSVSGPLGAVLSQATLCVNAQVTATGITSSALQATSCPTNFPLAIAVNAGTQYTRAEWAKSALFELQTGDTLQVTGSFASGQFTATSVHDTSIQIAYTEFTGAVTSVAANGNYTNVGVTVSTTASSKAPFQSGAQLLLPLTNSTSPNCTAPSASQFPCTVVTQGITVTQGFSGAEIVPTNNVTASGIYDSQLKQFISVTAIKVIVPPAQTVNLTGVLGLAPSAPAAPATICLAKPVSNGTLLNPAAAGVCPPGELLINITSDTRFIRHDWSPSALFYLQPNDALELTATLDTTGYTAKLVNDTSQHQYYTEFTGAVTSVGPSSNSAYTTVGATVNSTASNHSPVPVGIALMLPITNNLSSNCQQPGGNQFPCTLVTVNGAASNGYLGSGIAVGNTIVAKGVYDDVLKQFVSVTAITVVGQPVATATATAAPTATSTPVPQPVPGMVVVGSLPAALGQTAAPLMFCLKNAKVTSSGIKPNVTQVSPCPNGQLPVYVTASTQILRLNTIPYLLGSLAKGDRLQVTGSFINTQFTATTIVDLTRHASTVQFIGKVTFVSAYSTQRFVVVQVTREPWGQLSFPVGASLVINVQGNTRIIVKGHTSNTVHLLNPGNMVTVRGVYDRDDHSFSSTNYIKTR